MQRSYYTYLSQIKRLCTDIHEPIDFHVEDYSAVAYLAEEHCTIPFVLSDFRNTPFHSSMMKTSKNMMLNYYQIDQFTRHTVTLLESHGISPILLKGISLASYYPTPEFRKLGDLDLLIRSSEELAKAMDLLQKNGYTRTSELSDHHHTYLYTFPKTGRNFVLELHYRIVGMYQYNRANELVDQIFSSTELCLEIQEINQTTYRVLPPTEYVFYMIHHILKHYLYSGFGIRLLCDITFYLKERYQEVDFAQIHTWCQESRIFHLYEIVLETCRRYLALPDTIDPDVHYNLQDCDTFIERILKDGDMGTDVSKQLVGSTSYQKVNLITYFKEGHVQMKVRFPKAHRLVLLWPVLWAITLICFLKNTYTVRNTTFLETLRTFKKSNEKTKLIRIFDNSDT